LSSSARWHACIHATPRHSRRPCGKRRIGLAWAIGKRREIAVLASVAFAGYAVWLLGGSSPAAF